MKQLLLLFICLSFLSSCGKKDAAEELRPVRVHQVELSNADQKRTFSGTTSTGLEAALSFKVGGTLLEKHVQEGDRVKKGELLMTLDATDLELQAQEREASLKQSEATLRKNEANYKRVKKLYEDQNASRNDLDAARADFESSRSSVEGLEKRLALDRQQISYTQLKAPQDGIVAKIYAEVNENISQGNQVMDLSSKGDFEVTIGMPESFISKVKKGDNVAVSFPSLAEQEFTGKIKTVSYVANASSTYPVKITINEQSDQIRPGMPADVTFHFKGNGEQVIHIPSPGIAEDHRGNFVFTVTASEKPGVGIIKRTEVIVGALTDDGFEVLSGLNPGDKVVTAGVSQITDGMKVKTTQSQRT